MEETDIDFAAFKDGKCWGIATKYGPCRLGLQQNARTVSDWVRNGYEVREMPRAKAVAAHLIAISS